MGDTVGMEKKKNLMEKTDELLVFIGTPGWVRTSDLRLRRPLLYPAELRAQ
jgi:hypothetical protein